MHEPVLYLSSFPFHLSVYSYFLAWQKPHRRRDIERVKRSKNVIIRNWKLRRPHPIYHQRHFKLHIEWWSLLKSNGAKDKNWIVKISKEKCGERVLEYDNNKQNKTKKNEVKSTFNSKTSGYRNGLFAALDELEKKNNAVSVIVVLVFCLLLVRFFFSVRPNNSQVRGRMRWHRDENAYRTLGFITLNRLVTPEIDQSVDHRIKKNVGETRRRMEWDEFCARFKPELAYSIWFESCDWFPTIRSIRACRSESHKSAHTRICSSYQFRLLLLFLVSNSNISRDRFTFKSSHLS